MLYPQREICYATMERDAANARYARLHSDRPWHNGRFQGWSKEPSTAAPYKYDMGVTIGVSDTDLRPDDKFLTEESASPQPAPESPTAETSERPTPSHSSHTTGP